MVHPARLVDNTLIDAILDMFDRRNPSQFAAQIEALLDRPDATALLSTIVCPTLVLCGRADGWAAPSQHEEMAGMIPGSRLEIVEGSGHMAPMERPNAVAAALVAWTHVPPSRSPARSLRKSISA
jgi:pimeloyl-ACP methyl ester carboxylesterase